MTAASTLDVDGVTVDFQGLRAIEKVSLSLVPGEILGLIGPNGAGKTTLVNVLTGFQTPTEGRVRLAGTDITLWPAFKRSRAGLARTFQSVLLFKGLSVMENIEAGALAVGLDRDAARKRALDIIEWLGLGAVGSRVAGTLPFGSERRVGIGRAIAMRPAFLLMDEPAAGLNDSECAGLEQVIRRVRVEIGCGILLIEHRMPLVFSLCDRIHVLEQGRSIAAGTPAEIRADLRVRQAYLGEEVS
ncbi:MAG TPA: ABC transporter ATP-binding protein [Verrucomicrobiae bacterium]|jgi:branched-chain amino acid transport system ATP-binding protein|nr:ABC transporter ATP-binding protein [Verrucomicrobiae bacterium]